LQKNKLLKKSGKHPNEPLLTAEEQSETLARLSHELKCAERGEKSSKIGQNFGKPPANNSG